MRAYNNLANTYLREKRLDKATALFRRATALDSNYAVAYNGLGNSLLLSRQPAEAETAFSRACRLDSGNAEFLRNRGVAQRLLADMEGGTQ